MERGRVGQWVSSKSYPRGRGPCKWCLLRMSGCCPASLHGWDRVVTFPIGRSQLSSCWKDQALTSDSGFDIISRSSESNPSSLDRQSLLLNSKFLRPKMMSCSFERLQFLEYYQEKKSSSLNSVRPQGVLRKRLFLKAAWVTVLAGKLFFLLHTSYMFLSCGSTNILKDLTAVSSLGHKNTKTISS